MTDQERLIKTIQKAQQVLQAAWVVMRAGKAYESLYFWQRNKEAKKQLYEFSVTLEKTIQEASQWLEHCAFEGPAKLNLATALNVCEFIYFTYASLEVTKKYSVR